MKKYIIEYAQKCDTYQIHNNIPEQPCEPLRPVMSQWPFMKWGIYIIRKLHVALGGKFFMLAILDCISKWIEAKAFV